MADVSSRLRLAACALAASLFLSACGGGGASAPAPTPTPAPNPTPTSVHGTFPEGLAVGSPTALSATSGAVTVASASGWRRLTDWSRHVAGALGHGDTTRLAALATAAMPFGSAQAGSAGVVPDLTANATELQAVLDGTNTVSLDQVIDIQGLFAQDRNAGCFGPGVGFRNHQDAPAGQPADGRLPPGDLGLWQATDADTSDPCVVAQMNQRVGGMSTRVKQSLLLVAVMRHAVAASQAASMPAAGATVDVAAPFAATLHKASAFASIHVDAATIALAADGSAYTYRLALDDGQTGAQALSGEIVLVHRAGDAATVYDGMLRVATFTQTQDPFTGCSDVVDAATGAMPIANVATVRYRRDGTMIDFGSRSAVYCGAPAARTDADWATQVASFTTLGELDPAVKTTNRAQGGVLGWNDSFTRFGGRFENDTVAGDFVSAWQAGTADGAMRVLALHSDADTSTDTRTVQGAFGFGDDASVSDGTLRGMICNWTGPGHVQPHAPVARFQWQTATLASGASHFTLDTGASHIAYAPTNSCASTTTEFDANGDGTVGAGEGLGSSADLDAPATGVASVQDELAARSFVLPAWF